MEPIPATGNWTRWVESGRCVRQRWPRRRQHCAGRREI